ncbi:hypothetical protein ACFFMN_21050 [Planobispora siamensis]|nr:hypothetical protein [Planobispora siamensis]
MSLPPTTRRLIPCVTVAALTLSACSTLTPAREPVRGQATAGGVVRGSGGAGTDPSGNPSVAVSTAPPSPSALTADAYRAELEQAREPVRQALQKVASTGGLNGLDGRVRKAADAVDQAVTRLQVLTPPPEVAAQHGNYLGTLRTFGGALRDAVQGVRAQETCTGPSVLTKLEKDGELSVMKDAAAALTGYPADVVSVKAAKQQNRRLPNGRILKSYESRTGRGSLKVDNGGDYDAFVVVLRGKKRVVSFYVRKKGKATISGIRDGKYKVYYSTGTDWDAKRKAFTRSCDFTQFGKTVPYKTTYSGAYIRWNNWTITLHSVKGGTVASKPVKPGDFPK